MIPRRYPHSIWEGAAPSNYSTTIIRPRFVVVHVAQGSESGIVPWFHDPNAQVSAHLFNPKAGPMLQFVDLTEEAYAECAYNAEAWSVEHEGFSGEHLTDGQKERIKALANFAKGYGIPPKWRKNALGAPGWVSHGSLGVEGGAHPLCPGLPIIQDVKAVLAELRKVRLTLS